MQTTSSTRHVSRSSLSASNNNNNNNYVNCQSDIHIKESNLYRRRRERERESNNNNKETQGNEFKGKETAMVLSTEWSQVEVIDLVNDGNGLGFILVGGRSTGVVIKALTPGGVAERDNRLQCGDHLLQIGEVNLRGFNSEQVATVLRQTGAQVRLIVARPIEPTAIDYQSLASHAPIIPTKLLSDPEELSRHLFQNPSFATSAATIGAGLNVVGGSGDGGVRDMEGVALGVGEVDVCHGFIPPLLPTTPDTELADLPLPPLPTDSSATAQAASSRMCPKDLDIVPISIISPPPTTTLLPAWDQQHHHQQSVIETGASSAAGNMTKTMTTSVSCDVNDGAIEDECISITSSSYMDSPETETYEVKLRKNVYGLGITVAGYVCEEEDLSGIFVKSIIEGSAAEMSGDIQINDRIVAVDRSTLSGVSNHEAVELLRNTDIEVHLTLERFLRGRKYEHLQVALTELKGETQSQTSLPASPSIATLSWFPPKSDADSIVTDGGAVIMDFGDLPSRDTVESNMSHMLDRSEQSFAGSENDDQQMTPTTPDAGTHIANGSVAKGNGIESGTEVEETASLQHEKPLNGGMKTPTNEFALSTITATTPTAATTEKPIPNTQAAETPAAAVTTVKAVEPITSSTKSTSSPSSESLKVAWKSEFPESEILVAEINKLSGLGISLEGTVDVEGGIEKRPHHYIRSILEDGPVGRQGILRPGDELLQVNEHKLQGLKHIEVVKILKELPTRVKLICVRGPTAPSVINTSQNPEAFETRSLFPGGHQSLQNLLPKAQSESSLYTSSTATLTDQIRSKSLENVSGLALWSSDITQVDIEKTEQGFGFSILDYQDPLDPEGSVIVIRGLIRGGSAEATNEIFPGDRLISVGQHNLNGLDLDEAVAILKSMPLGITKLGICRPLSTSESNSNIASPVGDSHST